jgi:hypothetical protein
MRAKKEPGRFEEERYNTVNTTECGRSSMAERQHPKQSPTLFHHPYFALFHQKPLEFPTDLGTILKLPLPP